MVSELPIVEDHGFELASGTRDDEGQCSCGSRDALAASRRRGFDSASARRVGLQCRIGLQVQHHVTLWKRAADQRVALRGRIERLRVVANRARNEA